MDGKQAHDRQSQPLMGPSPDSAASSQTQSRERSPERTHSRPTLSRNGDSTTSQVSQSLLDDVGTPPSKERPRVRFSGNETSESTHGPVSTAHAKPKKSNFHQPRTVLDSASREENEIGQRSTPSLYITTDDDSVSPPQLLSESSSVSRTNLGPATSSSKGLSPPRPLDGPHDESIDIGTEPLSSHAAREQAAQSARTKAERLSQSLAPKRKTRSAPGSRTTTPPISPPDSPELLGQSPVLPKDFTKLIPLERVERENRNRKFGIDDSDSDSDSDNEQRKSRGKPGVLRNIRSAAKRLTKRHRLGGSNGRTQLDMPKSISSSGVSTPGDSETESSVHKPAKYRVGVLGALLNMHLDGAVTPTYSLNPHRYLISSRRPSTEVGSAISSPSPMSSPPSSGRNTPKPKIPKWTERDTSDGQSTPSLSFLVSSSASLGATGAATESRPSLRPRQMSSNSTEGTRRRSRRSDYAIPIRLHIEQILKRQEFLLLSCTAFMAFGMPTHRLEEYMTRLAIVLEVHAEFLYTPGTMLVAFSDPVTHTTETKMLKVMQGIDLTKLDEVHRICKAVSHDKFGPAEAIDAINVLRNARPRYNVWFLILAYGVAAASVGPFAFGGRPIDMPVLFGIGLMMGFMHLYCASQYPRFATVFEILAPILSSFIARAVGSIHQSELFCFPALAQAGIAIILPGFQILGAALDLQARKVLSGSVRMVHAIVYSLVLGFSLTVGFAIYGAIDSNASQDIVCKNQTISSYWAFLFCALFTLSLCVLNQAGSRQMPVMLGLSMIGYTINRFCVKVFSNNAQIANAFAAAAIGTLGNLYSRFFHGASATVIIPALMVQIPSSLTAQGSLLTGLTAANQLVSNGTKNENSPTTSTADISNTMFNVSSALIQIAIGITVGLFFSAWVTYPNKAKRSGLFSF